MEEKTVEQLFKELKEKIDELGTAIMLGPKYNYKNDTLHYLEIGRNNIARSHTRYRGIRTEADKL